MAASRPPEGAAAEAADCDTQHAPPGEDEDDGENDGEDGETAAEGEGGEDGWLTNSLPNKTALPLSSGMRMSLRLSRRMTIAWTAEIWTMKSSPSEVDPWGPQIEAVVAVLW